MYVFLIDVSIVVYSLENKKRSFYYQSTDHKTFLFPFLKTNVNSMKLPNMQTLQIPGEDV